MLHTKKQIIYIIPLLSKKAVATVLLMSTLSRFKLAMKSCPVTLSPVTESLYQLGKTVGHPLHIYGRWYRSHKYIIGLDLGKLAEQALQG